MIQAKVQKMMEEWNMVTAGDRLLTAVSGGADSVCLLLVLKDLQETMGFFLEAIHVEHGIRGEESLKDQSFVEDLCLTLGIPLTIEKVNVPNCREEYGWSEEEAARKLRYDAFSKVALEKHAKVVLAHHMEDNAETVLFQMLRGSRLMGLCGMHSIRKDEQGVEYLRPLLGVHRQEIEEELARRGQGYCIDSTNCELEYSRNYLRNVILPQMLQLNHQGVLHINQMAWHMQEVEDFLQKETDKALQSIVSQEVLENKAMRYTISVEQLMGLHTVLQKEVLLRVVEMAAGGRKDITAGHIADLLALCEKQSGREVHLPYQLVGKKAFGSLVIEQRLELEISNSQEENDMPICVTQEDLARLLSEGGSVKVPLGDAKEELIIRVFPYDATTTKIPQKTYTKWLDYDRIKQGFCIRTRQTGDYFIGDAMGHRKKLQNYFVDEKIPMALRDGMWLVAQESLVLWLIDGRISENVKVTEDTQYIVELEYIGG